jgi:hypothetical protein
MDDIERGLHDAIRVSRVYGPRPDKTVDLYFDLTVAIIALTLIGLFAGCRSASTIPELPEANRVVREPLVIQSDIRLPVRHRLLDELVAVRTDICTKLNLPTSDEPIHVYVFEEAEEYAAYVGDRFPGFPCRRAIFVKNDTTLRVLAYWGDRVAEDLRHELTHAYLHAVIPNLPLWLDEGLAEYYEVGRGRRGLHRAHIAQLSAAYGDGTWRPDLRRLELLENSAEMTELEYAESWLWTHFLLESSPEHLKLVQDQLARLRMSAEAGRLIEHVDKQLPDAANILIEHLRSLAEQVSAEGMASANPI